MTTFLFKFFYRIGFGWSNSILCVVMFFLSQIFGLTFVKALLFTILCGFLFFLVYSSEKRYLREARLLLLNMSSGVQSSSRIFSGRDELNLVLAEIEYYKQLKCSTLFIRYCLLASMGFVVFATFYSIQMGVILFVLVNATSLAALLGGPIEVFLEKG